MTLPDITPYRTRRHQEPRATRSPTVAGAEPPLDSSIGGWGGEEGGRRGRLRSELDQGRRALKTQKAQQHGGRKRCGKKVGVAPRQPWARTHPA